MTISWRWSFLYWKCRYGILLAQSRLYKEYSDDPNFKKGLEKKCFDLTYHQGGTITYKESVRL